MSMQGLLVTIPHAGEKIPDQTPWLSKLPEQILMFDVDRFVDRLYEGTLQELKIPYVKTEWHRYAVDLNRVPTDIDQGTVIGATETAGKFSRGYHWAITTQKHSLMPAPMTKKLHDELTQLIFEPFHKNIVSEVSRLKGLGAQRIYHIDLHSMPSVGTSEHRDPGEKRAEIVVSDVDGKSCSAAFKDLVISAYEKAGFKVAYNWPYKGGRITEQYGNPSQNHHCIQVELNRSLYMDEVSKKLDSVKAGELQKKLRSALQNVVKEITNL
ncbi:MAG: N-formylglutamate amidohydrolase [Bdellovibrionota bacterium]